jgi:hypothetical protein
MNEEALSWGISPVNFSFEVFNLGGANLGGAFRCSEMRA